MTETKIGKRPVSITKEGELVKLVFHPMVKGAKHPKSTVFSLTLSKADLDMIKKSF